MKRHFGLGVLLACLPVAVASADRCIGPKDTNNAATSRGAAIIDPDSIVFCDDFDSYCNTNWNADPRVQWPGYPPNPDTTLCTSPTDGLETYVKQAYHWYKPYSMGPQFGITNADNSAGGKRFEGWDGNPGWASLPYAAVQAGNETDPVTGGAAYGVFDMSGAINNRFPGSTAVNGTDEFPLVMRFWTHDDVGLGESQQSAWGKPANWAFYMELTLDGDRAPTDFTLADGNTSSECVTQQVNRKFPVICQQVNNGLRPPTCPPLSTTVHAALALGWVAPLDVNPCDVETGRKPTMYHAATFDGLYWRAPRSNQYPGSGDFNYGMSQGMFEMSVKTSTYDIKLIAPHSCIKDGCANPPGYEIVTNTATLTRQYTGPFNKIAMGIGMACELDPATGDCMSGTVRDQHGFHYGWSNVYPDRPVVYGGVGNLTSGACCLVDGTCQETSSSECASLSGRFNGSNSTCATTLCCPLPYADADTDGDVDQDDFGAFQMCYNGAGAVPTGCECYDRNTDGKVDATDFQSFGNCWTGPNVPWSTDITPNCAP